MKAKNVRSFGKCKRCGEHRYLFDGVCFDCMANKMIWEVKRAKPLAKEKRRKIICAHCGRLKYYYAKGLCTSCYDKVFGRYERRPGAINREKLIVSVKDKEEVVNKLKEEARRRGVRFSDFIMEILEDFVNKNL